MTVDMYILGFHRVSSRHSLMPKIVLQISVHARHYMQNKKGDHAHALPGKGFTLYMKSLPYSVLGIVLGNTIYTPGIL